MDTDLHALDPLSQEWVDAFVARVMTFTEHLAGHDFFDYQRQFARRYIESVVVGDGETLTSLQSRQSGKTEVLSNTTAAMMILFPALADVFPDMLGKFREGVLVGCFAPVEEMARTLHDRIADRLMSDHAKSILGEPDFNDKVIKKGTEVSLSRCRSLARRHTANPRAKIEGKSYHIILLDESQDAEEYVVNKSIAPMGAFYNATMVMTGTPGTHKGVFYKTIQHNKRRGLKGGRQNHFEFNWRACARNNPDYAKFVRKEMTRLTEDSDAFQQAYNLKWLLGQGMFVSDRLLDELADPSMQIVKAWSRDPVVVGIDPARAQDSTVVTVVWVGWDRAPDEYGFYDHRILNWMELHNVGWEEQYFRIKEFLAPYRVGSVAVDSQGVGDVVADRLTHLLPYADVHPVPSDPATQSERWTHLMQLLERRKIGWPGHSYAKRTKVWKTFDQQMRELEKHYQGKYVMAKAPEERGAHDDYADSLALACILSKGFAMPEVEVSYSPFARRRG